MSREGARAPLAYSITEEGGSAECCSVARWTWTFPGGSPGIRRAEVRERPYHRGMSEETGRDETDFRGAEVSEEAREALGRAMRLQAQGEVNAALEQGRAVVDRWPEFGQAHGWLGQTLVTRKRRFADGLEVLSRAEALAPEDPYVLYSVAWCREFVANELARPKRAHQPVEQSADELYAQARETFLRALELEPDDQLQGDIEDMLDVIANATGVPWDEGEVGRAQPRPR